MILKIHGAGQEVGRSCIEVVEGGKRILFDAGLKINHSQNEFPEEIDDIEGIDEVLISHIHLDHIGALPQLYARGLRCNIYASPLTKYLMPTMLHDSWKVSQIERFAVKYEQSDVDKVISNVIAFPEKNKIANFAISGANVKTIPCAHVPGSRSIFVEFEKRNVLYTGDFSLIGSRLVQPINLKNYPKNIDTLIVESTYGNTDHPDRKEVEEDFISSIKNTLSSGGTVLIPTFSIGRAQEIIVLLNEQGFQVPIFLDGMAKSITEQFLKNQEELVSPKKLFSAFKSVKLVKRASQRDAVLSQQCIVVTTAGMLDGGPICQYIKKVFNDPKTAILLTGYQAEGSNGRRLLNEGVVEIDDEIFSVSCFVKKFDFSAHAGMSEIHSLIQHTNPKNVILQHGEMREIAPLREYVEKKNMKCFVPKTGDIIEV
jgi:putative mRNA 3-end processing factor